MMEQDRKEYLDKDESEKMCSSKIGEAGEMCSPADTDTCGKYCVDTKERLVEILYFRHFHKHIVFTDEGEKMRNREINDYINVSVVVDIEWGDTRK